jgi:hypothetical protein
MSMVTVFILVAVAGVVFGLLVRRQANKRLDKRALDRIDRQRTKP